LRRPWALPLLPFYAAGASLRDVGLRVGLEQVKKLQSPVISVGSLSAGGAGKTPFVIALAELLRAKGVDVLSRGYGRSGEAVERVDPAGNAERFGDEPLLIARETGLPVFVGARRFEAGLLAESQADGTGLHLLDDGFQHRQLARDVDIVLVSSEDLNDWLLPVGNLREWAAALRRASVLAVPSGDDAAVARLRAIGFRQPVWRFRRIMDVSRVQGRVLAFCGIARPGQFFSGLEAANVSMVAQYAFSDHHRFSQADIALLNRLAGGAGAQAFVTTAKDRVRLGPLAAELALPVQVASLRIEIEDTATAVAWLERALGSA
jgi:tetraacyldisaccharide 4'-kinase